MAARRSKSVCLFCQSRQALVGRRRMTTNAKQRLETVAIALRPEDDGFYFNNNAKAKKQAAAEERTAILPLSETIQQCSADTTQEAPLSFEALWQRKDLRLRVLRSLSNPWPDPRQTHQDRYIPASERKPPEANAAPIPHEVFRRNIKDAYGFKAIRKILRTQFLRCEWPKEILRVIAVAMQNPVTAKNVAALAEPIIRALYRCRANVSDPEVLRVLNTIVSRFWRAGLRPQPTLYNMGLKFGARARSLPSMKRYLKLIREAGTGMTSNNFRSIIAKCSIGHRGLGEIRNGRWKREQLIQVLTGFEDCNDLPLEQQYHLGTFLDRADWQFLHGWVAVLARCKDAEGVWAEWEGWKKSPARLHPRNLDRQDTAMTSRKRGDYWFIEQMTYTDDLERAWQMVAETGLPFDTIKDRVKTKLLDGVEFATIWDERVRSEMLRKYDLDLRKIEKALGVTWIAGEIEGEGVHELVMDQEEALHALGSDEWKLDEDYGFPLEDEEATLFAPEERPLHDAEEKGLAHDVH